MCWFLKTSSSHSSSSQSDSSPWKRRVLKWNLEENFFMNPFALISPELENVKSFTRTNINKPDFTPRKARKSRHFWHFKPTKQNLWGFLWWINVDKLSIYGSLSIDLKFVAHIFPKMACFCQLFCPPNFSPQLANFFTRIYPWHFPTPRISKQLIFKKLHIDLIKLIGQAKLFRQRCVVPL